MYGASLGIRTDDGGMSGLTRRTKDMGGLVVGWDSEGAATDGAGDGREWTMIIFLPVVVVKSVRLETRAFCLLDRFRCRR